MPKKTARGSSDSFIRPVPSATPEGRENQLIALAVDLAEKQLREGTASSQTINHYLKLASPKSRLEIEILEEEKKLIKAKTEALESAKRMEELYDEAIKAMRQYRGEDVGENNESDTYLP